MCASKNSLHSFGNILYDTIGSSKVYGHPVRQRDLDNPLLLEQQQATAVAA